MGEIDEEEGDRREMKRVESREMSGRGRSKEDWIRKKLAITAGSCYDPAVMAVCNDHICSSVRSIMKTHFDDFFLITYTFIEKTLLVNASKLCSCLAFLFLIQKVLVYSYNPRRALEKPRALHGVDTVVVVYYLNWKKKKKLR